VADEIDSIPRYQWFLRVIGRYLDTHGARTVAIMEGPGEFMVAYACEPASPELIEIHFSSVQLQTLEDELIVAHRRRSSPAPGRYEDFLRAVGFELERQRAYNILIAELEDGFLVTYQYLNPAQGYMVRKHMSVLHAADGEQLLVEARGRRTSAGKQRRTLREFFT
jgi:hypothetical protein